jgi:hypothetical protein
VLSQLIPNGPTAYPAYWAMFSATVIEPTRPRSWWMNTTP